MTLSTRSNRCLTVLSGVSKAKPAIIGTNGRQFAGLCLAARIRGCRIKYNKVWQLTILVSPFASRCIMFFKRLILCAVTALFSFSGIAAGQTDFFLSFNDLNQGAVNEDAVASFNPGDSGTIYIYWTTNGPADSDISTGAFVDLNTSQTGVIEFTAAETLEFDVTLLGNLFGPRWGNSVGSTAVVTSDLVDELSAFTVLNSGIREANNGSGGLVDEGYDIAADAFLFGKVDFVVTAEPTAESVDIAISTGSGGIVNQGEFVIATHGIATVEINAGALLGDVNLDGQVDMDDVNPFIDVILNGPYQVEADINQDGAVNLLDVTPFIGLL